MWLSYYSRGVPFVGQELGIKSVLANAVLNSGRLADALWASGRDYLDIAICPEPEGTELRTLEHPVDQGKRAVEPG